MRYSTTRSGWTLRTAQNCFPSMTRRRLLPRGQISITTGRRPPFPFLLFLFPVSKCLSFPPKPHVARARARRLADIDCINTTQERRRLSTLGFPLLLPPSIPPPPVAAQMVNDGPIYPSPDPPSLATPGNVPTEHAHIAHTLLSHHVSNDPHYGARFPQRSSHISQRPAHDPEQRKEKRKQAILATVSTPTRPDSLLPSLSLSLPHPI